MKKLFLLTLVALFTFGMNAQDQPQRDGNNRGPGQGMRVTPKERAARLAKQLELTDQQVAQLEEFYTNQDKNREAFRNQTDQNRDEMRAKFDEQRKADEANLEKILGKEKYQKYVEQREQRMRERGNGNGGGQFRGDGTGNRPQ